MNSSKKGDWQIITMPKVAMPRIECKEQEQADICLKPGCRLVSNNTDCLTTDIPTEVLLHIVTLIQTTCLQVRLEDQVCEECKEGRTKLRPGLVQVSSQSYC